ncbi:MAG: hypothetical protein ABSC03_18160 [Verrucomicrobiota bacterium]|jgi:hypothetical protein
MKKWLKRIAFALAALVTLGALLFAEENYRGKRAWEACKKELEARGEKLDWAAIAPSAVPDDENFARTPFLVDWMNRRTDATNEPAEEGTNSTSRLPRYQWQWTYYSGAPGNWRSGTVPEPVEWQQRLRAQDTGQMDRRMAERYGLVKSGASGTPAPAQGQGSSADSFPLPRIADPDWLALRARPPGTPMEDMLFLLRQHEVEMDELRAAARRPYVILETNAFDPARALPRLASLKALVYPFRASACIQLEAGHPETALADLRVLFALGQTASSQPVLIGSLVRLAITGLAIDPIWFGLARHRWQDAQLAELETSLANINIVADFQHCLRGDRTYALAALGEGGQPSESDRAVQSVGTNGRAGPAPDRTMRSLPGAFRYQNLASLVRTTQVLIDKLNPAGPSVRLSTNLEQEVRASLGKRTLYNSLARMLLPALSKSLERAAYGQAAVSLARVACALERHRLATGSYPEKLDGLTPRFIDRLPPDPVNGEPLKYRRDAPDRFILYSVGANLKDDGGRVDVDDLGRIRNRGQGDWVWRSEPVK